ncbi:MAG: hypothetical protein AAGI38_16245 [Bacteroidota bacterium]
MRYFSQLYFPVLFCWGVLLLAGCATPERILPRDNGNWQLSRMDVDLILDGGAVESFNLPDNTTALAFDSTNYASVSFEGNGNGEFTNVQFQISFRWSYDRQEEEITLDFSVPFLGRLDQMKFQVLSSDRDAQSWRLENRYQVDNPFTREPGELVEVIQWQLIK